MVNTQEYGQFCPIALASDILGGRWTLLVLRELLLGNARFNELRRGLPRMSPALLSKRLKDLETHGLITRSVTNEPGVYDYRPTPAGEDLWQVIYSLGIWGHRWIETKATLRNLDPSLLMWDMRRSIKTAQFPAGKSVIQFVYRDLSPEKQNYWLIVNGPAVDACYIDPGFEVDVFVETDLATMTKIWMGLDTVRAAMSADRMNVTGDRRLIDGLQSWLGLSAFAPERKRVA